MDQIRLEPEERLLLALSRLQPSAGDLEDARMAVGAPAFRWERAVELACYQRVHALLARNLDDASFRDLVPTDIRKRLLQIRMAAELRNERYAHATADAFARLAAEGIPVLLLKGAALAAVIFPPGSRPLNDIDLLVRPEDYPRVAAVLREARFQGVPRKGRTEQEMFREEHEMGFYRRMGNETLALDVHWRVFSPDRSTEMSALGYVLPVADLLARAAPVALGPVRALAPSLEDMFVHTATQIGIDGLRVHLGRLADLDALMQAGMDWGRLVGIATGARAAGITRLALALATMRGGSVPGTVLRRLDAACPTCGIATRVVAAPSFPFERQPLHNASRVVLLPLFLGRPWYRLLYWLSLVLPTAGTRRMHILRPPDSALAYLRRWRAILLAASCGALLLAQRAADAGGLAKLAARLRARLWQRDRGTRGEAEPERVERREPAHVE